MTGDFFNFPMISQGWECPVCHKVWAPTHPGPCEHATVAPQPTTCFTCGQVISDGLHYCLGPNTGTGIEWNGDSVTSGEVRINDLCTECDLFICECTS